MRKMKQLIITEAFLYMRNFFSFFFTFLFPALMLVMFGSIYGNEPSAYFNGQGTVDVSVPAYCAMIIGVTGLMAFPLTVSEYKDHKIYKRFDATPAGKGIIIAAQTLVNFFMTLVGFALLFVVGKVVYHLNISGHFLPIAFALLLSIASIFSLGFFFTAIAPNSKICNLLCYATYFVMIFMSGATMPQQMFPETIKNISRFLPLTHAVNILQGTFTAAPFQDYRNSIIILLCVFIVCLSAGACLYKRESWA